MFKYTYIILHLAFFSLTSIVFKLDKFFFLFASIFSFLKVSILLLSSISPKISSFEI